MLARWSGWGALPLVFEEEDKRYASEREQVRELLETQEAWQQARRTTLNAHYTSADAAEAMWHAAERLGFNGGRALEPGCGSGNFLGFAPSGAETVGVELDPTTAKVADHLYGAGARIHPSPFEEFDYPDGSFDLVIGNVPFGDTKPYDPRDNRARLSIHNYFLVKSLRLTRPGGLVVALTSLYTMDAQNPEARRAIASMADLVGAVRFPERAFYTAAGTDAIEDLLIFRRRPVEAQPSGPSWANTVSATLAGLDPDLEDASQPLYLNEYWADHPEMILGTVTVGRGMYRDNELLVKANGQIEDQLAQALDRIIEDAQGRGATMAPRTAAAIETVSTAAPSTGVGGWHTAFAQEGGFVVGRSGEIGKYQNGRVDFYRPEPKRETSEFRRLIRLRDAARALLKVQADGGSDAEVEAAQRVLSEHYDDYRRIYGYINRFQTVRTKKRDPETGERITQRRFPTLGGFRDDPDWSLVAALEVFDDDSQTAQRAPFFDQRVVSPPVERLGVDTPTEAVAVCLDESGTVTATRVAQLLGVDEQQAKESLEGLAYEDPESRELVPTHEYLSGNVRRKLAAARAAVEVEPRFQGNVEALEEAMPRQLEPGEIRARLGAPWIPVDVIEGFCFDVLRADVDIEHLPEIGQWTLKRRSTFSWVALTSEWGTERADGLALLDATLKQRLYTVTDPDPTDEKSKRRVVNEEETLAAREKQEALGNRFSEWVWEDDARAERLAGIYNELFSSVVLPRYDGSYLTLPGLNASFTPRPHQRDAVARILAEGRTLLAHVVGAGKTATMVMAAMELRRLGAVNKPAFVVPNHMLEQFAREWLQLYPTARILVADPHQFSKDRREEFVARCATGDWDGVIFSMSRFGSLPLGRQERAEYLSLQVESARAALARSRSGKRLSVKKLEKRIARLQAKHKELLAEHRKDSGVRWEETGIDYLFVDEAHLYKNRRVDTAIDDASHDGSQRAEDLDAKLWALRRERGPRIVTFATATPIANSIAEMWVMQAYLQPDVLEGLHMARFDAWAANFGRLHTAMELSPDGSSYRLKTRFARFVNVPELLQVYRQVADVRTQEDLNLPVPKIHGDEPETVVVESTDDLMDFMADLARRAEDVRARRVKPTEDNMLRIATHGRQAALDLRLVGMDPDPSGGKIVVAARRIAEIYESNRENRYVDSHGEPSPVQGALQLVFCDVSTPAAKGWNAYAALSRELARRGIPEDAVRYVQDAKDDDAKGELFADSRDGYVATLLGSTQTMGVGTNVQTRAVALHHLDAPWRPADVEQRDGRIRRQGNQHPEVQIIRYVTERSFDAYIWQTLQRKAEFISQVTRGDVNGREVDDIGHEEVLSYAEVKALASGNPLIIEKAEVDNEVARLSRLESAWREDQRKLRETLNKAQSRAETCAQRAERLDAVVAKLLDTRGDKFKMTVEDQTYTARAEAGEHIQQLLAERLAQAEPDTAPPAEPIGQLGGMIIKGRVVTQIEDEIQLLIPEATKKGDHYLRREWNEADPARLIQAVERRLRRLPEELQEAQRDVAAATDEANRAEDRLGQPWEHAQDLSRLRWRQQELEEALYNPNQANAAKGPAASSSPQLGVDPVDKIRHRLDNPSPPSSDPPDLAL